MSRESEPKQINRVFATYQCGMGHTIKVERTATYDNRGGLPSIDLCPDTKCNYEALLQSIDFK